MEDRLTMAPTPASMGRPWVWIVGVALYTLLIGVGLSIGGELGSLATASFNALPFAVLAVLAYFAGQRFNWAWIATGLWLALLIGGAILYTFGLGILPLLEIGPGGFDPASPPAFTATAGLQIGLILLGILLALVAGGLMLLTPLRRRIARILPIEPTSFTHTIALVAVVSLSLMMFVPLLVIGEPPLLAIVDLMAADPEFADGLSGEGQLRSMIYGLIWTVPATFLAVGYGSRRSLAGALGRLGLVRPTLRQALGGAGIALLLAFAITLLLQAMAWLWATMGWPATDNEAFSQLLSFAINPIGALVIGVTAGLGEELAVRGVLQPRLGLLLSNIFFTSLHAMQYSWDGLIVVFIVGLVCGVVRNRTNTTTAAIVHGVYNFTLVMMAVLAGA